MIRTVTTEALEIAYFEVGKADGWPVVLSHGFPYDPHAYDEVAPRLARSGAKVIIPYLRGFGPTRFLSSYSMRSGQQAALGKDVIDLLDAHGIERAILAGYDWGGLASCVASALWPHRVAGVISYAGYDIIDVERLRQPFSPSLEQAMWYPHLFQNERGRECLTLRRRELCRALWEQWSPTWAFDDGIFERTAASFDNPDFVKVVVHAYCFSFGNEAGDPALAELEARLSTKPPIIVPAVTFDGTQDPLKPGGTADHAKMFKAKHQHRMIECGHNIPGKLLRNSPRLS
ncbi:alpha/beta hydrolase [Brucella sp. NM4]|uniref:alpha/beta hydrolase n=1 Tax=Brucella sp. NM4 TaxID=3045175 RepID=UPI0032D9D597